MLAVTPPEWTQSHEFPSNWPSVLKKHALEADDDIGRPAKRQSQTPNTSHHTPSEKEGIHGFDAK